MKFVAQLFLPLSLTLVVGGAGALNMPRHAARTLGDASIADPDDALAPLAIARAKSDSAALQLALEDPHLPAWLRLWIDARHTSDLNESARLLEEAAARWRLHIDASEPDLAARLLDHDRAENAFARGGSDALRTILYDAIGLHRADRVWQAYSALSEDDASERASGISRAWASSRPLEQRNRVFAWTAELLRDSGRDDEIADAWLDYVEGLRTSAQRRHALQFWDERKELREAVAVEGMRVRLARWLVRNVRREEALQVVLRGATSGDREEAARCHVLVAEQYYRLRRHDELATWLKKAQPSSLTDEERASLDAYPWGVRRRNEAASTSLAEGFDEVVSKHSGTSRAAEALWEAAWMWELSGELSVAAERFERYAREHPRAPFAKDSTARAVFLRVRQGESDAALTTLDAHDAVLGDSHAAASALWVAWGAANELEREDQGAELWSRLEENHGFGPFLRPPPLPLDGMVDLPPIENEKYREIFRSQQQAFEHVAAELGITTLKSTKRALLEIEWLFEHGLHEEGDERLSSYAWTQRRSWRSQLECVHLAWRMGRAEQQARIGWRLRQGLHGRSAKLDRALDICAYPTPFTRDVVEAATREGIPTGLLYALMRRESFFDPAVVSLAGAYGLLQLMPATAGRMASELNEPQPEPDTLRQPLLNLRYGAHYLRKLLDETGGNPYTALASYNAGEANGARWWARLREGEPPETVLLLISYSETRAYVYHVLRYWSVYGETHPLLGHPEAQQSR